MRQTCVFSGSSHPYLTDLICERLGTKPDKVALRKFSNGETSVEIQTSVRNQDVFIVQSGSSKINDSVMELLIMISACKGGSSKSITAVMPYFPYSRQSKRKSHRGAITARMLANLMHVAGVDHVITIDLHASQSQGFFKCPVDNLIAEPILAKWIKANVKDWREAVVVSKNPGGTKRVTSLADALKLSFGIVTTERRRPRGNGSLENSVIFGNMGLDGALDDQSDRETEAEAHIFSNEPANLPASGRYHAHSNGIPHAIDFENAAKRPSNLRASTTLPSDDGHDGLTNGVGALDIAARGTDENQQPGTLGASSKRSSVASLQRMNSVLGTTQSYPELTYDSDPEEGADEEYTDVRARDVVTGRLIKGHIVEDDASPALSAQDSNAHNGQHRASDDDPPEHMLNSFVSVASSRMPEHGLGGTADATASDEEEEEALVDPELEHTITLVGNVKNRPVFIVDDIMDKAGSWIAAAETAVKRGGATEVYCMATHGLFGGDALQEMQDCKEIDRIVVTNAFPLPEDKTRGMTKLAVLDVSNLLSEAIRRNHHGESISALFQHFTYD